MRAFRTLLLTVVVMTTSGCASRAVRPQTEPTAVSAPSHSATASWQDDAVDAPPPVRDPWEGFNRRVHGFNNVADKYVLRPIAVGYTTITPEPVQSGVSRFFANLRMPVTVVNQTLQWRPAEAAQSLGRFVVNTTAGIGGIFDPAARFGLPEHEGEDFGQTLAVWGWNDSRYLVLPLFGPRTVRDAVGLLGDRPLSPIGQVNDSGTADLLTVMQTVDGRARLLSMDTMRREALDDYTFVRDAWAQRRNAQIRP